ncbi:hypothetical protein NVP1081O_148 [Vibrio phage 1.081.O._10N.286.52.C2]|nr:hypothetical protein NVP1081O_148 [Vibrio phage 1.081.O._10N.286.52.C2]
MSSIKQLEIELADMHMESVDDYDCAVTVSCKGMSRTYTVDVLSFEQFINLNDDAEYCAFEWHGIHESLHDEELDFRAINEWASLDDDEREVVEALMDHNVCMSVEDAVEKMSDVQLFTGSKEAYAQDQFETSGILIADLPYMVRHNIDWDAVYDDLEASEHIIELANNRRLTVIG